MVEQMPWIKVKSSKKVAAVQAKLKLARGHKSNNSIQEAM